MGNRYREPRPALSSVVVKSIDRPAVERAVDDYLAWLRESSPGWYAAIAAGREYDLTS